MAVRAQASVQPIFIAKEFKDMASSSSMRRDPALIPVVVTLWLALGLFIVYPFIKLLTIDDDY